MVIHTTAILDLLGKRPGRYIQHDLGRYRMKEQDGSDAIVEEGGRKLFIEPTQDQMDDLLHESRIKRVDSRYLVA